MDALSRGLAPPPPPPPSSGPPARPGPSVWLLGAALAALLNLLAALAGGLGRLGLPLPDAPWAAQALAGHGALLMAGFFGSLITLERVVALRRGLGLVWLSALAALPGLAAGHWTLSAWLWLLAALGLLALYLWAGWRRSWSLPLLVESGGALALSLAALCLALGRLEQARLCWSLFLVLTIAGERRELMRLRPLPRLAPPLFLAILALALLGGVAGLASLFWLAMGALAAWLLGWDLARLQWRLPGWAGHSARCLLVGYTWLSVAALLGLAGLAQAWHALWLGFVMAMVMGHAPLMLPALAGLRPRHGPGMLWPLGLLGLSLALRLLAQAGAQATLLLAAGLGHVLALLAFGLLMARACRAR